MQGIDPISQMIGALSAQVSNLSSGLTDLRAEILTNRTDNDKRWREIEGTLDKVYAEYRTVKHLERNLEQVGISLDTQFKKLDSKITNTEDRLRITEDIILIWRTKAALVIGMLAVAGGIIMYVIQALLRKWVG